MRKLGTLWKNTFWKLKLLVIALRKYIMPRVPQLHLIMIILQCYFHSNGHWSELTSNRYKTLLTTLISRGLKMFKTIICAILSKAIQRMNWQLEGKDLIWKKVIRAPILASMHILTQSQILAQILLGSCRDAGWGRDGMNLTRFWEGTESLVGFRWSCASIPLIFRCGCSCHTFRFSLSLAYFGVQRSDGLYHIKCFMKSVDISL